MAKAVGSALQGIPHLDVFDDIVKARFEALDFTSIMMYVVDTAPEEALFYLASQFNVLGWKGWNLAPTIQEKRELIKKAIELKRFAGTPWAVETSLTTVGFVSAQVHEGVGVNYDGEHIHDGDINYSQGNNWANFRVTIELPVDRAIDAIILEQITRLINEYKNTRSNLVDVTFSIIFSDNLTVNDEIDLSIYDDSNNLISNEQF